MGIKQLMNVINEKAPESVRKKSLDAYSGKVIACDASMAMYQFLLSTKYTSGKGLGILTDETGNPTSHLVGLFNRTVQFIENGIKPIWVFDGKPPSKKSSTLLHRKSLKKEAYNKLKVTQQKLSHLKASSGKFKLTKQLKTKVEDIEADFRDKISKVVGRDIPQIVSEDYECKGESEIEDLSSFKEVQQIIKNVEKKAGQAKKAQKVAKQTVCITLQMASEAKTMLRLMGVPVIEAPSEAEAQCAELVKTGKAYAVASEDMDSLCFGAEKLLKGFNNKKEPILEITLGRVLDQLGFTLAQFLDFCILLGCDYCDSIKGIGPSNAYKLIQGHFCLEKVIPIVKADVPENFCYQAARDLFLCPEVIFSGCIQVQWSDPQEPKLKEFLVLQKNFSNSRVETGLAKIVSSRKKKAQLKLDSFLWTIPKKRA